MEVPRSRADKFSYGSRECDHVVFDFSFDRIDPVDRERCAVLDFCGILFRNSAFPGEGFDDGKLYIQPPLVFVLVLPDLAHLRTRVSLDHGSTINESGLWVCPATSQSLLL